ncbi:hypothetical protein EJP82_26090 [Paenibacillus anaericanus]|uniref:Uncharacterized protein n=1 Tax=Paenibacillus anaericanus TaxID=170367 RepID=A0A3S1DHJ6_9BACL|nr:hypothetical protein [Paenibacillus anaericanus]RUT39504.1 hypothetical protein EJP82_26090 [Paenibacillus anaericanus]
MIAVLVSETYREQVNEALIGTKVIYEHYGKLTWTDLELCIQRIRNMDEVDLLILDTNITGQPQDIVKAVKNYRLVREYERVLVIIPDDMELAESLAALQVYDFVVN